jgi:pSer/pThr/pTyr-binding forkhead associated (FHA) protein
LSVHFAAASVSSKHLEFTWLDGDWFALDMGSSNGTRLNESQVPMMAGAL